MTTHSKTTAAAFRGVPTNDGSAGDTLVTLIQQGRLLEVLTENVPDLIYVKDLNCCYVFNNAAHLAFLGLSDPAGARGKTVLDFYPRELAEEFLREEKAVVSTGVPIIDLEEQTKDSHGMTRWVSTTKVPVRRPDGRIIGLAGISRDITERKKTEEELAATVRRLHDVHEKLLAAQLQLCHVTKLHSIGALAAGMVHEIKTPLTVIALGLEYLSQSETQGDRPNALVLADMRRAVEKGNRFIQNLLNFCRNDKICRVSVSIRGPIEQALLLMQYELKKRHVETIVDIPGDLPSLELDATRIEQVFVNLIANALHAMPGRGTLTIEARHIAESRLLEVAVRDTGTGIPPELLPRVFEPFVTTRPPGEGTGLGLTIARSIMELHDGEISLHNRPEGGATALLTFKLLGGIPHETETTVAGGR